jgi:plastocyanin
MKLIRVSALLLLSILVAGAVVACGDDDDEESNGTEPTASRPAATEEEDDETATPTEEADETGGPTGGATGGADDEVQVETVDLGFDPENFTVPAGVPVKIEVTNSGALPHTLTVYEDEEYNTALDGADTGRIEAGEDGDFTSTFETGDYFFRCEIHPDAMEGDITAE